MAKKREDYLTLRIPKWVSKVYICLALILVPWTIYLGLSLPRHHLSSHWDVSWTGLDTGIVAFLLLTGVFAIRRSMWLIISASSTASLLLVDAWFDILSEHNGGAFHQALVLGLGIEVPLAAISYYVAAHALRRTRD